MDKELPAGIPAQLRIGPHQYRVERADDALSDLDRYGDVRHRECRIRIDCGTSPQQIRTTLLHEILHATTDVFLQPDDQLIDKHLHALVYALLLFAADNPEAMRYIFDGDSRHTDNGPS